MELDQLRSFLFPDYNVASGLTLPSPHMLNKVATRLSTVVPTLLTVVSANCKVEVRIPPTDGSVALHFASGVATTTVQWSRTSERRLWSGPTAMLKFPAELVTEAPTTIPRHFSWTVASVTPYRMVKTRVNNHENLNEEHIYMILVGDKVRKFL